MNEHSILFVRAITSTLNLFPVAGILNATTAAIVKPEITPKQRWHWAYNKIIMQLNVSRLVELTRAK